jgi:hypothetical protein
MDPKPIWTGAESLACIWVRSPDQPVACRYTDYTLPPACENQCTVREGSEFTMKRDGA